MKLNILPLLIAIPLSCVSPLFSCDRFKKEASQAENPRGGRCYITKDQANYLCLDFTEGYDANTAQTTCATEYNRYKKSTSAWGQDWLVGDFNTCDTSGSLGSCARSDGVLYYYSKFGNAAAAESDCVSTHSGTWTTSVGLESDEMTDEED